MRQVLITGFEPFGGERVNPSAQIALALDGTRVAGHRVRGAVLSCRFGSAARELRALIDQHAPELVVCFGQAGGRRAISLERVAINVDDARITDNAGAQPVDEPVVRRGPVGYFSTLPIKSIVAALRAERIRAEISQTAGTFVCNHVFYALMHALRCGPVRGGFVHVPLSAAQAKARGKSEPSMPLVKMVRAAECILRTSINTTRDVRASGGAIH